jgi:hypothetical protein
MTKWICLYCHKAVQKYSLVNEHLESHKKEQKKKQEINIMIKDMRRSIR